MQDKNAILATLPFYGQLREEEKLRAQQLCTIRIFEKDALMYSPQQKCLGLIKVLSGRVRVTLQSDGREITLYTLSEGDIDILSASCIINQISFEPVMMAEEKSEVLIFPVPLLSPLMRDNIYVRSFIHERLTERFSDAVFTLQQIVFKKMDQRLAGGLMAEYMLTGSTVLTITQEQLARRINSAREVVTRLLKGMEKEGLLKVSRGTIEILDTRRLEALAEL